MRVDVDEAGRDDLTACIEDAMGSASGPRLDGGDAAITHEDIGLPTWRARAVDDEPASDQQIIHRGSGWSGEGARLPVTIESRSR